MSGRSLGVIVTGGTGALGRAVVADLVARGHRVAVPYRDAHGWEALRAAIGEGVFGLPADMGDLEAARAFAKSAAEKLGGIDGLAALAGGYLGSTTLEASPEAEWDQMMRSNLTSAYAACRASLPYLLVGGGSVVTVASRTAELGGAGAAAYSVSKMAVVALTRALAHENRGRGVRFNAISPGTIDTEANRLAMPKADRSSWTPPERIARVVAWLLGPDSPGLTGAILPV